MKGFFNDNEIDFLISQRLLNQLYKDIFTNTPPAKPIKQLWDSEHKLSILAMMAKKFKWVYYYNAYLSLFFYIKKVNKANLEDIKLINTWTSNSMKMKNIGELNCSRVKSIEDDFITTVLVNKIYHINLLSQEYLLKYLFEKNIYKQWSFNVEDVKLFLEKFNGQVWKFTNLVGKNKYVIDNLFAFYEENEIFNPTLCDLFVNLGYCKKDSLDKVYSIGIDKRLETWSVIRLKSLIDKVIDFTKKIEKEFPIAEYLKTFKSDEIKQSILEDKSNDIYHSTTIEGYKINFDQVKFINEWILPGYLETPEEKENFKADTEEILVIKSYKRALEMILDNYLCKEKDLWKDDLVKINYFEFIEEFEQQNKKLSDHNYRNHIVRMNGCEGFLPPETIWEIDALVDYLFEKLKEIDNYLLKGIACHFLLVPIQPFWDGNWRLSRFVMNILFSFWGYKWVTIDKHDYRLLFLSSYGLAEDYKYQEILDIYRKFINFILHYVDWKLKIEKNEKS